MSAKTMKIVIGVLAVALVILGGLAVLKNLGPQLGGSGNSLQGEREQALESGLAEPDTAGSASVGYDTLTDASDGE